MRFWVDRRGAEEEPCDLKLDVVLAEEEERHRLSGPAGLSPASVSAGSGDAVCTRAAAAPGRRTRTPDSDHRILHIIHLGREEGLF